MAGGFLNRWSRLKSGEHLESQKDANDQPQSELTASPDVQSDPLDSKELLPTVSLDDVEKIDRFAPDFSAFMKPGVDPAVQQAALKKMFSDPHFNVMDGLDIYIDDYSKPDPIPMEMLKRMTQSDMLNIFRKDESQESIEVQASNSSLSKPAEQALPLDTQTDLTSTQTPEQGVPSVEPVSVDKKTS